ncbi:hypothetical protein BO443_170087 [Burkholderia orbicola]
MLGAGRVAVLGVWAATLRRA